jgi:hypothetical protein
MDTRSVATSGAVPSLAPPPLIVPQTLNAASVASIADAQTGNTLAVVVVRGSSSVHTDAPGPGSNPSRDAASTTGTPHSVLFPGFFTSSWTSRTMHVQQLAPAPSSPKVPGATSIPAPVAAAARRGTA